MPRNLYSKVCSNKNITCVLDPPGIARISPDKDTFFSKRDGKPYDNVVCEADCLPICTYQWYHSLSSSSNRWTTGQTLFTSRNFSFNHYQYFFCKAKNSLGYSYSKQILVKVKGKFVISQ